MIAQDPADHRRRPGLLLALQQPRVREPHLLRQALDDLGEGDGVGEFLANCPVAQFLGQVYSLTLVHLMDGHRQGHRGFDIPSLPSVECVQRSARGDRARANARLSRADSLTKEEEFSLLTGFEARHRDWWPAPCVREGRNEDLTCIWPPCFLAQACVAFTTHKSFKQIKCYECSVRNYANLEDQPRNYVKPYCS